MGETYSDSCHLAIYSQTQPEAKAARDAAELAMTVNVAAVAVCSTALVVHAATVAEEAAKDLAAARTEAAAADTPEAIAAAKTRIINAKANWDKARSDFSIEMLPACIDLQRSFYTPETIYNPLTVAQYEALFIEVYDNMPRDLAEAKAAARAANIMAEGIAKTKAKAAAEAEAAAAAADTPEAKAAAVSRVEAITNNPETFYTFRRHFASIYEDKTMATTIAADETVRLIDDINKKLEAKRAAASNLTTSSAPILDIPVNDINKEAEAMRVAAGSAAAPAAKGWLAGLMDMLLYGSNSPTTPTTPATHGIGGGAGGGAKTTIAPPMLKGLLDSRSEPSPRRS